MNTSKEKLLLPKIEMKEGRILYHIEFLNGSGRNQEDMHQYYGSLSALCKANPRINATRNTILNHKFPFKNGVCIIRKGTLKTIGTKEIEK